jgi:hypothetical protein
MIYRYETTREAHARMGDTTIVRTLVSTILLFCRAITLTLLVGKIGIHLQRSPVGIAPESS